jgi:hypothetical protein
MTAIRSLAAVAGCLLWLILAARGSADILSVNLERSYPVVEAENSVWIGTPAGLLQYNPEDDTFRGVNLPEEVTGSPVRDLRYKDEWLWCLPERGLAALHIRLNEWLFFDASSGLPSDTLTGIAFEDDYVWVSTAMGAARFDLLIEEWEAFDSTADLPERSLKDIVAADGRIWTVSDRYVSEFEPTFEKWRHYKVEQDTGVHLLRAFTAGLDLWLVSDAGLIRFDMDLRSQQAFLQSNLAQPALSDLLVEDERIWALTGSGLHTYDSESQVWREFEGNSYIRDSSPVAFDKDPSKIWVISDKGVAVWDAADRNWEVPDYASGLSVSTYRAVYTGGGRVFLIGDYALDYRPRETEGWRRQRFGRKTGARIGRDLLTDLFDNEEGGRIRFGSRVWGWEGTRITLLRDYEWYFAGGAREGDPSVESGERLDVKSRIGLGEDRSLSGFFNNIDYSEIMYGVHYRDRGDALVREASWGDFRREAGATPFGQPASMFGSTTWLQAGPKTERFKRSLFTFKAETGERRSEKTYQHIRGAFDEFENTLIDTDYLRNHFRLPGILPLDEPEDLRIYVDDMISGDNTPNTLERHTIAGITGDFDVLVPTEDYYQYRRTATIAFLGPLGSDWTIVATYLLDGVVREEVLQHGAGSSTVSRNVYFVGGQQIIPYSFELAISDSLGHDVPLSEFGLDYDRDGSIDSDWMDYESGLLTFPNAEPFPPEVYDETAPGSVYRLTTRFETRVSLIRLAHADLVRGSEVLTLDGVPAEGGNDYVLDYTNGTLVFVREGIVNPDTRIEIEYEYYPGDDLSQVTGATLNLSPGDGLYMQGDWLRIERDNDQASPADLGSLHSELRQSLGDYDIRVIPGIAYQADKDRLGAGYLEGLVSSRTLRLQARYEDYSKAYTNLYRPQSVLGQVGDDIDLFGSLDVRRTVRITGEWKRTRGYAEATGAIPSDRSGSASLLINPASLPSWEVTYRAFKTKTDSGASEKHIIEGRLKYQVPSSWVGRIGLQGLKTEGLLRTGKRKGDPVTGADDQEFHQGYLRLNADVSDRFQGGFFYRRNDLYDISGKDHPPVLRSERSLLTLSHEEWSLFHLNLRAENTLDRGFHRGSVQVDARLSQYSQLNARVFPGDLLDALSDINLEFNVNRTTAGSGATESGATAWLWEYFNEGTKGLLNARTATAYFAKKEFRPWPGLYVNTLLEWNHEKKTVGGSSLTSHDRLWSEIVELKIGFKTRLMIQYRQYFQDRGRDRLFEYRQPSVWVEHRWTPDFHNVVDLTLRQSRADEGEIHNETRDWTARYDLIWRRQNLLGMDRVEVRQSLSGSHSHTKGYTPGDTYNLSLTPSIDLYPLHSTIIRTELRFSRYWDRLDAKNDYHTLAVDLRLSLKF